MIRTPASATLLLLALSATGAAPAATIVTLDMRLMVAGPSLAIGPDGLPSVAWRTFNQGLRIFKCARWDCATGTYAQLDGTYFAESITLAFAPDQLPVVAYRDSLSGQLMLVKCADNLCLGGDLEFRTIAPSIGHHLDFDFGPDGRAAFAFQELHSGAIKLGRCTTPGCGGVETEVLRQHAQVTYAEEVALQFAGSGEPVIAGRWTNSAGSTAVNFFDCSQQPCADSHVNIGNTIGQLRGFGLSMDIGFGGAPMIAYKDQALNHLELARCLAPDCGGTIVYTPLDQGSFGVGPYTALAVRPDHRVVVAYQKNLPIAGGVTALYVAECQSPNCSSVERVAIEIPASGGETGVEPAIAIDHDGAVVIAYYRPSPPAIRLARCNALTCAGPGDRLFHDGFQ